MRLNCHTLLFYAWNENIRPVISCALSSPHVIRALLFMQSHSYYLHFTFRIVVVGPYNFMLGDKYCLWFYVSYLCGLLLRCALNNIYYLSLNGRSIYFLWTINFACEIRLRRRFSCLKDIMKLRFPHLVIKHPFRGLLSIITHI